MGTAGSYRFQVGNLECIAIHDGSELAPVQDIVRGVPPAQISQAFLERGYSPTEYVVEFNNLYIQAGQHKVLVDAGWGKGVQRRDGALLEGLQAEGISPADIDTLVITHFDADHVGGIVAADGSLVFPNAEYILLQDAWDFWHNEPLVAKWPEFLTLCGRRLLPLIRSRVKVVSAGAEFLPGLTLIPAPGHRAGHTALEIVSAGEVLFHLADVAAHPVLMEHPSWPWAFDAMPPQAAKDKALVLGQAAARQALVFGPHLPFPGVGRVTPQGDGWRWQPLAEAEPK